MNFDNVKADRDGGFPREILETDKCDWCKEEKAIITDGTYVYCSDKCKEQYYADCADAIEWAIEENRRDIIRSRRVNMDDKMEVIDHFQEDQNDTLINLKKEWEKYKKMLMNRYPAEEDEEWEFTCDHHKKIDKILDSIKESE